MTLYDGIAKRNEGIEIFSNPRKGPFTELLEKGDHQSDTTTEIGRSGIILIDSGSVQWRSSRVKNYVTGPNLIVFGHSCNLGELTMSDDFNGYLLLISTEFINSLQIDMSRCRITESLISGPIIKNLNSDELSIFRDYIELIYNNILDSENAGGKEITKYLSKALYYKILNTVYVNNDDSPHNQDERILKRYLRLVYEYGYMHRDLAFYANVMCITPKYLSAVISKASGKKASKWLSEATINKAKFMLKETSMPINQISETLQFQTPSDFCRYFSHHEGVTPLRYRNI